MISLVLSMEGKKRSCYRCRQPLSCGVKGGCWILEGGGSRCVCPVRSHLVLHACPQCDIPYMTLVACDPEQLDFVCQGELYEFSANLAASERFPSQNERPVGLKQRFLREEILRPKNRTEVVWFVQNLTFRISGILWPLI